MSEARRDTIYWGEDDKQRLLELAEQDRRSMAQEICWLIDQEYRRRQLVQVEEAAFHRQVASTLAEAREKYVTEEK